MVYVVHMKGTKPFATQDKREATKMLYYLLFYGFHVTLTKMTAEKYWDEIETWAKEKLIEMFNG